MNLTDKIHTNPTQFKALINDYPKGTPVVMINILRFKAKADCGNETGEEAYARYGQHAMPYLKKAGAKLLWRGRVRNVVIGDEEASPQIFLLVQYPSVQHFVHMVTDPDYVKLSKDRTIAIEYGGLIACETEMNGM